MNVKWNIQQQQKKKKNMCWKVENLKVELVQCAWSKKKKNERYRCKRGEKIMNEWNIQYAFGNLFCFSFGSGWNRSEFVVYKCIQCMCSSLSNIIIFFLFSFSASSSM